MSLALPVPLSTTAGRVRVHCPAWPGGGPRALERALIAMDGVRAARANPFTRNVLVFFDECRITLQAVLRHVQQSVAGVLDQPESTHIAQPHVVVSRMDGVKRARITVRGLDRDPRVARRIVEHLRHHRPHVRVVANPLTSRVLVEFPAHLAELEEVVAEITHFELPALPDEDHIHHPLDPAPAIQSGVRVAGAAIGLGLIVTRRLMGADSPLVPVGIPARVAGILGFAQGFPAVRLGMRKILGRTVADLLFFTPIVVSLALSESILGLAVTGIESLRLLTEIVARRHAWERYESRLADAPSAHAGNVVRIDSGQRTPLPARIEEGTGTASGRDGLPVPVGPGASVSAGARLYGGPFVVELLETEAHDVESRPSEASPTALDRYVLNAGLASLAYGTLRGLLFGSWTAFLEGLLLVNPRTAVIGSDFADISGFARMLHGNVVIVGTRHRATLKPDTVVLDSARVLTEGYELSQVLPLGEERDIPTLLSLATGVAVASGSPYGPALGVNSPFEDAMGAFDGETARATLSGQGYVLMAADAAGTLPLTAADRRNVSHARTCGCHPVLLARQSGLPLALLLLRPRLVHGVDALVSVCRRRGIRLLLLTRGDARATEAVASRARIERLDRHDGLEVVRELQAQGQRVCYVADDAGAAAVFTHCDMAIGLSAGRGSRFPARADLLAPDVGGVALILEATARKARASRDSIALSILGNVIGGGWGLRNAPGVERASVATYVTALAAMAAGWFRLQGGQRPTSVLAELADPRPERWGARSVEDVLTALNTTPTGLSTAQALQRRRHRPEAKRPNEVLAALGKQLRSPLPAVLGVAAGLALTLGATLDFVIIVATLGLNLVVGTFQEVQTDRAADALKQISSPNARVVRDGQTVVVPAPEVVTGDVLVLGSGDRIAADARLIEAHGLEVDEAALTGESHPVAKLAENGSHANHVVLEGSDVVVGTGRAIVVAVGRDTRLGATAAALALHEDEDSPLARRLAQLLKQLTPVVVGGGILVVASGIIRTGSLLPSLALGASIALASVPEGLPLLAAVGEAAVARRLHKRRALVRRLSSVEALGRVDVACTDKTGTLTTGRLAVRVVACGTREAEYPTPLTDTLRHVLLTAALASPHPDAHDVHAHPTDVAVIRAAEGAGLDLRQPRHESAPFDPSRSFHSVRVQSGVCLKGAPEVLLSLCTRVQDESGVCGMDESRRQALLANADRLARRGLRVLMVAEGPHHNSVEEPHDLTALGFIGLSDPLRPNVATAVHRCQEAGIRVIMLTGDHATTARVISQEAGLHVNGDSILGGAEMAELDDDALDRRLRTVTVIARATPLDKLRIIESLRRCGHTIAMTGDGVNDAPALRLADVGVAMGRSGTEVARQAADLVLLDDDFATLVEALVEGRSFWRNMRRSLGLLLGGNLGELGLVAGASLFGTQAPLTTAQILAVNLLTDALPALSVVLQKPEHRNLAILSREGMGALNETIRRDVVRRGTATALPSVVAYVATLMTTGNPLHARSVAFASVVSTQLAQTLDAGYAERGLTLPVLQAVTVSGAMLAAAFGVPVLQSTFGLAMPGVWGWSVVGAAAVSAVAFSRVMGVWLARRPALT